MWDGCACFGQARHNARGEPVPMFCSLVRDAPCQGRTARKDRGGVARTFVRIFFAKKCKAPPAHGTRCPRRGAQPLGFLSIVEVKNGYVVGYVPGTGTVLQLKKKNMCHERFALGPGGAFLVSMITRYVVRSVGHFPGFRPHLSSHTCNLAQTRWTWTWAQTVSIKCIVHSCE